MVYNKNLLNKLKMKRNRMQHLFTCLQFYETEMSVDEDWKEKQKAVNKLDGIILVKKNKTWERGSLDNFFFKLS